MAKRNHKLFTVGNAKTQRGESRGYYTAILHLAPYDRSGVNLCPMASPGCIATCLNTAGRGRFDSVQNARLRKSRQYLADPRAFEDALSEEIAWHQDRAERKGLTLVVRVNGTSDLPALARALARRHPDVQFYDYTKIFGALLAAKDIPNLHYTFSRSEENSAAVEAALALGVNVAVPFAIAKRDALPMWWNNVPVTDGDIDDLRFLDVARYRGYFIGLRAKSSAKKDTTGFVVRD